MFKNHQEAGQKLALALSKYKDKKDIVVLAIPRGGVEVGYQVADYLNAELGILVSRKLHYANNPEFGFGGMAEDGSFYLNEEVKDSINPIDLQTAIIEQKKEIKKRITNLRHGKSLPSLKNKIIILVDDGIATGVTMQAAVMMCRNQQVKKIIVAVPIGPRSIDEAMKKEVDELVVLEQPFFFSAVAQGYKEWHNFTDEEVLLVMKKWENKPKN